MSEDQTLATAQLRRVCTVADVHPRAGRHGSCLDELDDATVSYIERLAKKVAVYGRGGVIVNAQDLAFASKEMGHACYGPRDVVKKKGVKRPRKVT